MPTPTISDHEKRLDIQIGEAIATRREQMKMTQRQLGSAIGVTFQQVQKYERGVNRIAGSKLILAADALKCDAADLLGNEREEVPGAQRLIRAWSCLTPEQRDAVSVLVEAFRR